MGLNDHGSSRTEESSVLNRSINSTSYKENTEKIGLNSIVIRWPLPIENPSISDLDYSWVDLPDSRPFEFESKDEYDQEPNISPLRFFLNPKGSYERDIFKLEKRLAQTIEYHFQDGLMTDLMGINWLAFGIEDSQLNAVDSQLLNPAEKHSSLKPKINTTHAVDLELVPFYHEIYRQDPKNTSNLRPRNILTKFFFGNRERYFSQLREDLILSFLRVMEKALALKREDPNFQLILAFDENGHRPKQGLEIRRIEYHTFDSLKVSADLRAETRVFGPAQKNCSVNILSFTPAAPPLFQRWMRSPGIFFNPDIGALIFNDFNSLWQDFTSQLSLLQTTLFPQSLRQLQSPNEASPEISDIWLEKRNSNFEILALCPSSPIGNQGPQVSNSPDLKNDYFHDAEGLVTLWEAISLKKFTFQVTIESRFKETKVDSYTPVVYFSKARQLNLAWKFELNGAECKVYNSIPGLKKFLEALGEGVGSLSNVENKRIAIQRKGLTRNMDLKILRHCGVFTTLLLECSHFCLGLPMSDGSKFDNRAEFQDHLLFLLGKLVVGQSNYAQLVRKETEINLERWVSKSVVIFIKRVIQDFFLFFENTEKKVFIHGQCLSIGNLGTPLTQLLRCWLLIFIEDSQGRLLGKQRATELENFSRQFFGQINRESWDSEFLLDWTNCLTQVDPFVAHLPLMGDGFQILLDGNSIETLAEMDLETKFVMAPVDQLAGDAAAEKQNIDWFALHPKIFFKGQEIHFAEIQAAGKSGVMEFQGKYYRIPQSLMPRMKYLERFWQKLLTSSQMVRTRGELNYFKLPRSQTLELLALRSQGIQFEGSKEWDEICAFYDNLSQQSDFELIRKSLSPKLCEILKPYQIRGVQWIYDLYRLRLGGILADEMGLGKTIQTLAFFEILRVANPHGPILVVVPTSLMYNWQSEAEKFTPDLNLRLWKTSEKEDIKTWIQDTQNHILVTTYTLMVEHCEFFENIGWELIVFDEAQNLKNLVAQRTTAARKLKARFKLCLTGTPFENNLIEYFSVLDLILPGCLGSLSHFRSLFDIEHPNMDELQYLRMQTKPLVLRRTKREVLFELPEKTEMVQKIPFSERQLQIYRDIASSHSRQVQEIVTNQGESKSQLQMLTALLRLRQVCSDPSAIPYVDFPEVPPKIELLLESVREHLESGESILVFTQFLTTLDRILKMLRAENIPCIELHGQVSQIKRREVLTQFNASKVPIVLVMTLKTGGVGLNLTKASVVYHLEPWWNPAVENQATDRVHRIGQTRDVSIYRFIMKDSLEEKIELLKVRKEAQFNRIFGVEDPSEVAVASDSSMATNGGQRTNMSDDANPNAPLRRLSKRDFDYLIGNIEEN